MMAHILTDKELEELLKDPNPGTICGFGGYAYSHKVDIYSFYLERKFEEIDIKYPRHEDEDNNKGKKGELLTCGIIDLTMWLCGFYLGKDYTVINGFKNKPGGNSVDFKLTCNNKVFLIEAKNWNISTYVDKRTYDEKIKTRFFCEGKNILMIRQDKVPDVEKIYNEYPAEDGPPTVNGQPINYIEVSHFLDKRNDTFDIDWNLTFGVPQLTTHIGMEIDFGREFSLEECIQMGMPNWFITEYCQVNRRTVSRKANSLGLDRRSSAYKSLTMYRDDRYY